jgi:hypothetical protein
MAALSEEGGLRPDCSQCGPLVDANRDFEEYVGKLLATILLVRRDSSGWIRTIDLTIMSRAL